MGILRDLENMMDITGMECPECNGPAVARREKCDAARFMCRNGHEFGADRSPGWKDRLVRFALHIGLAAVLGILVLVFFAIKWLAEQP